MPNAARSAFNAALCAEVKRLRETKGWQQKDLALALGISEALVQKYETRTPLPHYLVPRFCTIIGTSTDGFYRAVVADAMRTTKKPGEAKPKKVAGAA